MAYLALCFDVDAGAADGWGDALLAAGALSVDIADPYAGTPEAETPLYAEPGEPAGMLWPVSRITALFAHGTDWRGALAAAAASLGAAAPPHEIHPVADADWVRATQAQFAPIRISERLWIVPTWCEPVDACAINIALDPGLAFGTGSHPTTRLCLEWLSRQPSERRIRPRLRLRLGDPRDRRGHARRRPRGRRRHRCAGGRRPRARMPPANHVDATFIVGEPRRRARRRHLRRRRRQHPRQSARHALAAHRGAGPRRRARRAVRGSSRRRRQTVVVRVRRVV